MSAPLSAERLLADLIALPTVNPAFLPGDPTLTGEARAVEYLSAYAQRHTLNVQLQSVLPGRSNIMISARGSGKIRRRILLAPHLDTVGFANGTESIFRPRKINGRLHGRGACDTKGSVAVMLTALLTLTTQNRVAPGVEILFCGLVDEENGQLGSRKLARSEFHGDLAIVGEPTSLKVVTAHKGDLWLELRSEGKSAHGSRPELGDNAIVKMARIIQLLEGDYARALRKRKHALLGSGTINVGAVRGGSQPNIVPAECAIQIDRRTIPGETQASVERELKAFLRRHQCAAKMGDSKDAACPSLETDESLPLVSQMLAAARQPAGLGAHFFCDAAILAAGGTPSVVFGPGDIAQAHTADEWISIASLNRATDILVRFLERVRA